MLHRWVVCRLQSIFQSVFMTLRKSSAAVSSSSLRKWTADQDQLDNRQLTHDQLSKWSLANIALISTSLPNPGSVTSIDVTLVAQIRHQGDLPFFVHGRSTICTAVPLTSAVMLSRTRSSLFRRQFLRVHVTAIDPHSPILQLFKLHLPSASSLRETA